ncbi:MAG: hypothetical protein M5U33_00990 [Pseudorhodoplanes sp.]|nr:hypothetical protein [Pseudorhodoplanes sp.]
MSQQRFLRSTSMFYGLVGSLFFSTQAAYAADAGYKPGEVRSTAAVDGVNAKIDGLGGTFANKDIYGGRGVLTLPLGHQYGLQLDGAAGNFDSRFFGSTAAHLF